KIAVFGDVMLDRYLIGEVGRISPEAPVPVVDLKEERLVAGGAANVAANIDGLGSKAVLISVVGTDREGEELLGLLETLNIEADGIASVEGRATTVKTRILSGSHQIARVDRERVLDIGGSESREILDHFESIIEEIDVLVISDYGKGTAEEKTVARLITLAKKNSVPVLVDPKGLDYTKYMGATVLTPNRKEALEYYHSESKGKGGIEEAGVHILEQLDIEHVLITLGPEGIAVFSSVDETVSLKASARTVFDVTGAGDTVIATLAAAVGAGADIETAARIANIAAGEVVGKIGTTPIGIDGLRAALTEDAVGESHAA
ncbi:MAG: PfkB family carbohydrate kinase, partial [Acidobacteriota bacterium]|nr:PfkB family carbohydrate kinase [Acidobacteriota bacterium]